MTEATESDKLDPALADIDPEAFKPSQRRILVRALLVIATVVAVAVVVPSLMIPAKKTQVIEETEKRLRILAAGRSQVLSTWLEGVMRPAERVVESELFRLPVVVAPSTFLISAATVLGSMAVSAGTVRRRLHGLDLVAVLKTRE